ncbi:MAG: xanthine dehydrogenase small subunit [Hyphomicrobiales bacterium]
MAHSAVRFRRRGKVVELGQFAPHTTLLDYLRLSEKSRGTKEGCGEGDCGACTVALGTLRDGRIGWEPVNACIVLLGQIDGKELVTVEDLAPRGELHPVQRALVDHHASQCGFCTPGFVMSLFCLYQSGRRATRKEIVDQIAGNLCRCTGYRPIVDAALAVCTGDAPGAPRIEVPPCDDEDMFIGDERRFFAAPAMLDALASLARTHPDAVILAGGTDVGLWITKQLCDLPKIIHIGRVRELNTIEDDADRLVLGSAVTYAEAEPFLGTIDPDIGEMLRRLGSKQVRAMGTVGGNIANGSPIGDTPPILIALGASIELRKGNATRELALEDFFIAYGRQDRAPGEILTRITVPKLKGDEAFRCYKISKRFDQDISAVMAAFNFKLSDRRIESARVAFGGMAATPKRAQATEAALTGLSLDEPRAWEGAAAALREDFSPIDDHRASAKYRLETARALLMKALIEVAGEPTSRTRIVGHREAEISAV